MFTARPLPGFVHPLLALTRTACASTDQGSRVGAILRMGALSGFLALGLPGTSSAQALSTMQVTARVVPASVAWTAVAEVGLASSSAAWQEQGRPLIRRNGLVHVRAEIRPSGGRRLLLVTIHHPQN